MIFQWCDVMSHSLQLAICQYLLLINQYILTNQIHELESAVVQGTNIQ